MNNTAQKPKYHVIRDELRNQIINGVLASGAKIPNELDLASHYGVSRLTVRQAISQLATEGVIQTIQGKGSFVAGRSKPDDINLNTIHLVWLSFHANPSEDAFFGPLLLQLCSQAHQKNLSITMSLLPRHQNFGDYLRSNGIPATFRNGVIIANVQLDHADLALLREERIPYVVIPQDEKEDLDDCPLVGTDDRDGIRQCVETLLRCNHREIALLSWAPGHHAFSAIIDTFKETLSDAGIPFRPELVVNTIPWDEEEGRKSMNRLLERKINFTGLVCSGDRASIGAVRLLLEHGYRIPEDISVVVFDRYPWMDSLFPFRLSGIQQNLSGLAQEMLALLEEQRNCGTVIVRRRMVKPDFISGNSCQYI